MIGTLVGAALAVGSSIYGGIQSAKAAKEAKREAERQRARENAWYAKRYGERYADTEAGTNLIRRAQEQSDKVWKRARGAQKIGGVTEAGAAMEKDRAANIVGDTLANVGAKDTTRRDQADLQHRSAVERNSAVMRGIENTRAQQTTAAAGQASNALMQAAVAMDAKRGGTTTDDIGRATAKAAEQARGKITADGLPREDVRWDANDNPITYKIPQAELDATRARSQQAQRDAQSGAYISPDTGKVVDPMEEVRKRERRKFYSGEGRSENELFWADLG